MIENSNFTHCFFTANHASNYLPLKVWLPEKKAEVIKLLGDVIAKQDMSMLRAEYAGAL